MGQNSLTLKDPNASNMDMFLIGIISCTEDMQISIDAE